MPKAAKAAKEEKTNGKAKRAEAPAPAKEKVKEAPRPLDRVVDFRRVPIGELIPNDKNFRMHPARQRAALAALFKEVGFVGAELTYIVKVKGKERLKLLDGHARREIIEESHVVPCLVTDLTEAEADLVLASYDAVGDLAENNQEKCRKQLGRLKVNHSITLMNMFNEFSDNWGLSASELGISNDDDEGVSTQDAANAPPSHVKMVQLFLSVGSFPMYEQMITELAARYGKDNPTDAVLAALEHQMKVTKGPTRTAYVALGMDLLHNEIMKELKKREGDEVIVTHGANKGKRWRKMSTDEEE